VTPMTLLIVSTKPRSALALSSQRSPEVLTNDEVCPGLLRLGHVADVSPHLAGCLAEHAAEGFEDGSGRVVVGVKVHDVQLDLEGICLKEHLSV
jgi:hypothetical protein